MTANINIELNKNIGVPLAIAGASGFLIGYITSRYLSGRAAERSSSQRIGNLDDVSESETPRSVTPSSTTESYLENGHQHHQNSVQANGDVPDAVKLVLIIREDLHLSPGAIAKDCSTACLGQFKKLWKIKSEELRQWELTGAKKMCLRVPNEEGLLSVQGAARSRGIPTRMVVNEGLSPSQRTVLAVGPAHASMLEGVITSLKDM